MDTIRRSDREQNIGSAIAAQRTRPVASVFEPTRIRHMARKRPTFDSQKQLKPYEQALLDAAKTPEDRAMVERFLEECEEVSDLGDGEIEATFFQPKKPVSSPVRR